MEGSDQYLLFWPVLFTVVPVIFPHPSSPCLQNVNVPGKANMAVNQLKCLFSFFPHDTNQLFLYNKRVQSGFYECFMGVIARLRNHITIKINIDKNKTKTKRNWKGRSCV